TNNGLLGKWLRNIADGALALREFTALLGVRGNVQELEELLVHVNGKREQVNKEYELEKPEFLGPIQNLRWVLFQPTVDKNGPAEDRAEAPYALVLSFVFDGDLDDALEVVAPMASTQNILSHCPGDACRDAIQYLKKHRVKSGYMFRDLGADRD